MSLAVIILAAGKGSRMKSDIPKVLHEVGGTTLLHHSLMTSAALDAAQTVVVTGHGHEMVEAHVAKVAPRATTVHQAAQNGTAHAVQQAKSALGGHQGYTIILYGDTPFITPDTCHRLIQSLNDGAGVGVLGFESQTPGGYGRLLTDENGLQAIVEAKDASPEELKIGFCNSGVVAAQNALLFELVEAVGNDNQQNEYYLTDIVALARARDIPCAAISCSEAETMGVNSKNDLAKAEHQFQEAYRTKAMHDGVTLRDPATVRFSFDTELGRDVVVEPFVQFGPGVVVADQTLIKSHCHLEGCEIAKGATIGPYARIRPGTKISEGARVGNFVEIKNASLAVGAKVNHLSYIGDASIGQSANIGAGTITCNYDGVFKHRTEIGAGAFIGSNSSLVAPVVIGDAAVIGSGSVITEDVKDGALALGRARQINKDDRGALWTADLRSQKKAE